MKLRGKDCPSGKNMAEYIDKSGYMDLFALFYDHNKFLPVLFLVIQRNAFIDVLLRWAVKDSLVWRDTFHIPQMNKVGCESI